MKKTTGICLFTVCITACMAGVFLIFQNTAFRNEPGAKLPEASETQIIAETEELMESMQLQEPYRYLLVEENGVLVVYEGNKESVLLETNIRLHGLDEETKSLLKEGIPITDEEELYDFLESYSS